MTKTMIKRISEANQILIELGLPRAQQNDRSALCMLALLNMTPRKKWSLAECPLIGITPIMDWVKLHYKKEYAPNSRETFRRYTIHQFVEAGIVLYNPDKPDRPVNSPQAVYQIEPSTLKLIQSYKSPVWRSNLEKYLATRETLKDKYAKQREQNLTPVQVAPDIKITISPGEHSTLIRAIIEDFAPRFAPNSILIYAGDTGEKWGYFDPSALSNLGVRIDSHGKMPDVVLYYSERNWLLLIEAVTSHGPVNGKRHNELTQLFEDAKAGLIFVTAFPNRTVMSRYISDIAWETEVWVADSPSHLIHFDGERFLGPYE